MRNVIVAALISLVWVPPTGAAAVSDAEIEHLLGFIERSDCRFIRNNTTYTAAEARQHITQKYNFLKKRIESAEQFITYAASKSSVTGKSYSVICDGETQLSKAWLEAELSRFRQNGDRAD